MLGELLVAFVSSFIGTLGFGVLLHTPKKALLWGGLLGGAGYLTYFGMLRLGLTEPLAMLLGAMLASTAAQILARRMRMIATVFVAMSIIPFVPGLGLYRCMSYLAQGQNAAGLSAGVAAMSSILMIALGVGVGTFLFWIPASIHARRIAKSGRPVL